MSKLIEVLKINRSHAGKAGTKGYEVVEVAYKDPEGKTKGMKVLDFVQREVFKSLEGVNDGDILDVEFEQNDKGYWQFKSVQKGQKTSMGNSTVANSGQEARVATKGNWETSEERAARQVMIVRQSSLSNTISYFELTKHTKATPEDVIAVAKVFEAFVLGTEVSVERGEVV